MNPRRTLCIALLAAWLELMLGWGSAAAQERTQFPTEARAQFDRARELQQQGKLKEAIQGYQEAISLGMQAFPRAHLYQADASLQMKQFDEAIDRYSNFLEKFSIDDSCRY